MSPEAAVQYQLEAYNARDLARFLAVYSDDIRLYRMPATEPALVGKAALAGMYATQRFNLPGLHAELLNRMVIGNKVIDHECVGGVREQTFEVAAVYEAIDGLILNAWFFGAD
jgi:hypothetical protein